MSKSLIVASLAAGLAGGTAWAAGMSNSSTANVAAKDFGAMSLHGHRAFDDVQLARLAIFDGQPAQAGKLVADARQSFAEAAKEDTGFTKAADRLQPPSNAPATTESAAAGSNPILWVPVDGQFVLAETLAPTGQQAKAIDAANQSVRNGHSAEARDALHVASVNANFILTVAPANATMADLNRASQLLAANDYYNANQALRNVLDGLRLDSVDVAGTPVSSRVASAADTSGAAHQRATTAR